MDVVFDKITKRYGARIVYEGFDLTVKEGRVTALLGPSGCGKTTLLNLAAGLIVPDCGRVSAPPCSYVFQTPRLLPNLTALGNLVYAGATIARATELLRAVEVDDVYPKAMSGGMAQRVGLARAFIGDKPLVLMDEPFKSLDVGLKFRLIELASRLAGETRATVLFVTHDPAEADLWADRAVVIDHGAVVYDREKEGGAFSGLLDLLRAL